MLDSADGDSVVEVDRLLMRDYRNRRNLNGPHRYQSALRLAEQLVGVVVTNRRDEFVREMLIGEPSSYLVDKGGAHLLQTAKLSKMTGDNWGDFIESLRADPAITAAPPDALAQWAAFVRLRSSRPVTEEELADLLDDSAMFSETRRLADETGSDLFWRLRDEVTREFGTVQKIGRRQMFALIVRALDELSAGPDPLDDEAERSDPAIAGHDGPDL
jgi:hypothetical protein